ncbi:hypothetical protein F5X99DRAFT_410698 [Biscogniauxia marginata]|nr:hypothetical protein F5X99DRAFT_410698 [Biscogniauxia marginata]
MNSRLATTRVVIVAKCRGCGKEHIPTASAAHAWIEVQGWNASNVCEAAGFELPFEVTAEIEVAGFRAINTELECFRNPDGSVGPVTEEHDNTDFSPEATMRRLADEARNIIRNTDARNKMASEVAVSDPITASDIMAVVKINWEKLAAKAGFKDAATARAHYETLLRPDDLDPPPRKRKATDDTKDPSKRGRLEVPVAKEASLKTEDGARGQFTSHYLYGLEDDEV